VELLFLFHVGAAEQAMRQSSRVPFERARSRAKRLGYAGCSARRRGLLSDLGR
ncbi:MAG: hypothetical protein K0S65_6784, partial [Labilithrix sp.]|nr:hypothetical protein [Labilithrix sp.]